MHKVKILRAEAQYYTELAQICIEWAQEYTNTKWVQYYTEYAQHCTELAAKLNKEADELEQADAQQ